MKIHKVKYCQNAGKPTAWSFEDFVLNPSINLIVGKNASGKTRVYNVLYNLASLLSGLKRELYGSGDWDITFHTGEDNEAKEIRYELKLEKHSVAAESLTIDGERLLKRGADGKGRLHYAGPSQSLDFQIATHELAAVLKRDSIQHPFLELLHNWAESALAYPFATDMGRGSLYLKIGSEGATDSTQSVDNEKAFVRDPAGVVKVYKQGSSLQGFEQKVKADMQSVGYDLEEIKVESVSAAAFSLVLNNIPIDSQQAHCLFIKEQGIEAKIPQRELSQGMFRALSLIIHLNYVECSDVHRPTCILIDDIGEGLDFERSTKLIQLLVEKVESGRIEDVQLIMTSNDRFVMNKVPLAYWTIIERSHQGLRFYNEENSREAFQAFELAGLNNFDMFSSAFYKGQE